MRLMIISNNIWNILNFRKALIKNLLKKNYEIIILSNQKDNYSKYIHKNISFKHVNFKSNFNLFNDFINIAKIFFFSIKYKPKIILNFTIKPVLFGSLVSKILNLSCINTLTGLGSFYLKSNYFKEFYFVLLRLLTSKNDYFFFHNKDDFKIFLKRKISTKDKSLVTMGSGVNLKKFKFTRLTKKKTKKFLMISRFLYNKGIIEFLNVAKKLSKNNSLSFEVLGLEKFSRFGAINKNELENYKYIKNLKMLNFKKTVINNLKHAYFVVLPSYREGMPKSLLEALSSGKPIITTNVAGCRDLVINNFNGYLCKAKSDKSLYAQILKASKLSNLNYKQLSKNSRKFAEIYLDENIVALKYLNLVNKIL